MLGGVVPDQPSPGVARLLSAGARRAEQVAHLSRLTGLVPGDVIATGTPAGVGMPKGTFLRPGDTVEIEIEGIGVLRNPVVGG